MHIYCILYVSSVLGCVLCISNVLVRISSIPGCVSLLYLDKCTPLIISMIENANTQNGPYCIYTYYMTVFRVVVSYKCNISGLVGSK